MNLDRQAPGRSDLFFIEFLIVLFFFLIISTACLRVFAAAYKVTQNADALAHAQTTAASIAEVLEAGEVIDDYFPEAVLISSADEGLTRSYQITWDNDFAVCDAGSEAVCYTLSVQLDTNTDRHDQAISISCTDQTGETIYELSVTYHQALTREEALS